MPEERKLTDKSLVWLDIAAGLIGAMLGHDLGKQIWKLVQGAKTNLLSQPQQAGATAPQPATTPAPTPADPTIHSALMGFGQWDEAATGMTAGAAIRRLAIRVAQATGAQLPLEQAKLDQLQKTWGYIAGLTQSQKDNLREAVGKFKTAELQAQFWLDLATASTSKKDFMNFAKTMGIVRDPSAFRTELAKGVANGLGAANNRFEERFNAETRRLTRRTRMALQQP